MISVEIFRRLEDCASLQRAWDDFVYRSTGEILGLDVTATFDWAMVLWKTFIPSTLQSVVALRDGNHVVGILPCFHSTTNTVPVKRRDVALISELFSGRSGFLLAGDSPDYLAELLHALHDKADEWDAFLFTLVDGGPSHRALAEVCKKRRYHLEPGVSVESPYVVMLENREAYRRALDKKFRENLNRRARKLRDSGELAIQFFRGSDNMKSLLADMLAVERTSWKQRSRTSLTTNDDQLRFFQSITPIASERNWLWAAVMKLGDIPVAYIYGLLFEGTFYGLKSSYVDSYRNMGVGTFLQDETFGRLCDQGVEFYDFMGTCEPYKMKWATATYSRTSYVIYRRSVRGELHWLKRRIWPKLTSRHNRSPNR